ncbi:MAG: hypothetical protein HYU66_12080 [Armatimonadetes bacterium]|nr:hypothetical protein [Armatimonadota bacterium]
MEPRVARRYLAALAAIVAGAWLGSRLFYEVPDAHPIATLAGQELSFWFRATDHPPYHLLVALPRPKPRRGLHRTEVGLRGTLELTDPHGRSLILAITRETMQRSNWLDVPAMEGWILAFDQPQQVSRYLRPGVRYHARVRLEAPARTYATLWLATVKHRSILFGEEM